MPFQPCDTCLPPQPLCDADADNANLVFPRVATPPSGFSLPGQSRWQLYVLPLPPGTVATLAHEPLPRRSLAGKAC